MRSLTEVYAYMRTIEDRFRFELIVVNDGSTDETGDIAELFARTRPEVRVLHHPSNFRIGQALRYGFSQSKGDFVVAFDADLSYDTRHIGVMLEPLVRREAKLVIASPYMKEGQTSGIPWRRRMMSKAVNRLLSATTPGHVATVTGMVRAYDGRFIRSLNTKAMGPEINTEILYKAQILRAKVMEVPAHLDWTGQEERMQTRRVSMRVSTTSKLLMFASFLFRPIVFFFVPGMLLGVIATWTLGSVLLSVIRNFQHLHGRFDPRLTEAFAQTWQDRPQSFIIGGVTLLLAVQLITLGLLVTQAKRYFEELFHLGSSVLRRVDIVRRNQEAVMREVDGGDAGGADDAFSAPV
jgi:Glycosyl transferase family 2